MHEVVAITLTQMLCVYTVWLLLVPRFLYRQRYAAFAGLTLATIVGSALLNVALRDAHVRLTIRERLTNGNVLIVVQAVDTLVTTLVFIAVATLAHSYRTDQRNKALEKERLETELNFLRAQINPHFFFNALNAIYVLIQVDGKTASDTLLKFSGLLRYHLYECRRATVPLERELAFLNDYVQLETLRNGDNLNVTYQPPAALPPFHIAPFLLIPFVENAFKHVSRRADAPNTVSVEATVTDGALNFEVTNTFEETAAVAGVNGIGLQNVTRRLELLYPKRHRLDVTKADGRYRVHLQLQNL
jgi:LytS/YehU family sensor histidine kinase